MLLLLSLLGVLVFIISSRISLRLYHSLVTRNSHLHNTPRRYPHLDPFLGLDLAIQTWRDFHNGELSEGLRRRHALYGRTFLTNNIGDDYIYTVEPENIRNITTAQFSNFGKSAWVAEAAKHVGNGVLLNDGEAWKRSRTMLKPIFARTAVDEPTFMEPHVKRLVEEMKRLGGRDGQGTFDFHELACMLTLDVVTEFLFGKSTRCMGVPKESEGEEGMDFLSLVKNFEGPSGEFISVGMLAWLGLLPSYWQLVGIVNGMKAWFGKKLDEIMAESNTVLAPKTQRSGVFTAMKAAGISGERIQGELQNVFFASYDTTSAFLANLIYVLVHYPGVQGKLREEVKSLGGRNPTNNDLSKMEYLRLVIMEALRLYSPVTSHSRTAKVDTILPRGGGPDGQSPMIIRAGATVIWSTYTLNRDPQRYGGDWAEFRPERWTSLMRSRDTISAIAEDDGGIGGGGTTSCGTEIGAGKMGREGEGQGESWRSFFMPFGSGPRTCLGQQMVQAEVSYVVVRLLQEFAHLDVEGGHENKPFREARAVSLYNADGVRILAK
ncbi:hypothetical protein VMCG_08543 [Cytospora schulzeri]|uniref:Cytochrome P450 n=1 Tax=Cytospora schulzeri TaxID=448051 RepID=A0A423VVY5_9PEZI|nr:hypothetical protein VMCG_08543 [Valsa malicola]